MEALLPETLAPVAPWVDAPPEVPAPALATAPARLIEFERGRHIALPVQATLEVIDEPKILPVPGAAYYGAGITKWQGRWLPVLDLHVLLNAFRKEFIAPTRYLLVLAYQSAPRQPLRHGVLALPSLPLTVEIDDNAACALPTDSDLWPLIALSCFEHEGKAVPVVDPARLFERYQD